jgi:hypothetical protein
MPLSHHNNTTHVLNYTHNHTRTHLSFLNHSLWIKSQRTFTETDTDTHAHTHIDTDTHTYTQSTPKAPSQQHESSQLFGKCGNYAAQMSASAGQKWYLITSAVLTLSNPALRMTQSGDSSDIGVYAEVSTLHLKCYKSFTRVF